LQRLLEGGEGIWDPHLLQQEFQGGHVVRRWRRRGASLQLVQLRLEGGNFLRRFLHLQQQRRPLGIDCRQLGLELVQSLAPVVERRNALRQAGFWGAEGVELHRDFLDLGVDLAEGLSCELVHRMGGADGFDSLEPLFLDFERGPESGGLVRGRAWGGCRVRCGPGPAGCVALLQRGCLLLLLGRGGLLLLLRLLLLLQTRLLLRLLLLFLLLLLSLWHTLARVGGVHPGCIARVATRVAGPILAALALRAEPMGLALGRRIDSAT